MPEGDKRARKGGLQRRKEEQERSNICAMLGYCLLSVSPDRFPCQAVQLPLYETTKQHIHKQTNFNCMPPIHPQYLLDIVSCFGTSLYEHHS